MNTTAKRPRDVNLLWAVLPVLVLLAGTWLRVAAVWPPAPFDVDEALYASFARQISHENNPLLIGLAVDKPPLAFYTIALSFKLFGTPSEWAARLPGLLASLVSVALLWQIVWTLYRSRLTALLAMLFLALSPLDVAYAGTAFTDALTTMWSLAALLAIANQRWATSGLLLGLAFATKQSAIIALPLILTVGWINHPPRFKQMLLFIILFCIVAALPLLWDLQRGDTPDWWTLGAANNAPQRLIRSDELLPRLSTWTEYLASSAGSLAVLIWSGITSVAVCVRRLWRGQPSRSFALDMTWVVFGWGYVSLYVLVAFNMYPRYAHILSGMLAILAARSVTSLMSQWRTRWLAAGIAAIMVLSILPNATKSRVGSPWLAETQRQHAGIEATADYLNTLPPGTIVYDHWTGWLLGWYTGQNRPQDMWLRIVYYPTPETLTQGALAQPDPLPRFFIVPVWAPTAPWLSPLKQAGFAPELAEQNGQFRVYRLTPPT